MMLRFLLYTLFVSMHVNAQNLPVDFAARNGLPNFFSKINKHKDTLTVAYLGGSITEANVGWRVQSLKAMKQNYPASVFREVNAAIGGTTSGLGVHRLNEHVFPFKPDLLFVEFAINDDETGRDSVLAAMESIVRKTWKRFPATDICFVYTFAGYLMKEYGQGKVPSTVLAMEELANYYQVPSINFSPDIVRMIQARNLFIQGNAATSNDTTYFSPDGVHPFGETGHLYYTQRLMKSLNAMSGNAKNVKHRLGKPFFSEALMQATTEPLKPSMFTGNVPPRPLTDFDWIARYMPSVYVISDSSQALSFCFTGESIGFMDIIGPFAPRLKINIDNEAPRYITRFDSYCHYTRCSYFFIDKLKPGTHHIRIQIVPESFDKWKVLGKSASEVKEPKEFERDEWWPGRILVNGVICHDIKQHQ